VEICHGEPLKGGVSAARRKEKGRNRRVASTKKRFTMSAREFPEKDVGSKRKIWNNGKMEWWISE
jgi:hypothetical protein